MSVSPLDEFSEPSSFSSVEHAHSPSRSASLTWQSVEVARLEGDSSEYKAMFDNMCQEYEQLRMRANTEKLDEEEFMARLGSTSPCFLQNPMLFTEVHEMWVEDYNRAQMHRVDPFQKALELLQLRLNPLIPEEYERRKKLQREILGPLKNPQVVFGATPFELRTSLVEKTSLRKQQDLSQAFHQICVDVPSRKNSNLFPSNSPKEGTRKLSNSQILSRHSNSRKLSSPHTTNSPRGKDESKSPNSSCGGKPRATFFGFRKISSPDDEKRKT